MSFRTAIDQDAFQATISLPVQWGDMDAFGHVNNTRYFLWLESSRIEYLAQADMSEGMRFGRVGPILASVTCNYRRQLVYPDTIIVGARVAKLGNTSLTMEHQVFSLEQSCLVADGESVIVIYDYEAQRPMRIQGSLRERIEAFEGSNLSRAST